jgi:hypothetical protein
MTYGVKNLGCALLLLVPLVPASRAAASASSNRSSRREVISVTNNGTYTIRWKPLANGAVPLNEPFDLDVCIEKSLSRQPADDVHLTVDAVMPAHHHGMTVDPEIIPKGSAHWLVRGLLLHMPGEWQLTFQLSKGGETEHAEAQLKVD